MVRAGRSSIPVIDLFAGPGGLGEGFSAFHREDGKAPFRIRLSIEANPVAHQTLRFRAFFRSFRDGAVPGEYYDVLRGLRSPRDVFDCYPEQAELADREAWYATLGATRRADVNSRIEACVADASHWVLIGGPPCQAYSLAGRSRNAGKDNYVPEEDDRQLLYVEYLQVIADHWPSVFVMENVKGLLSASLNQQRLFQRILGDLQSPREALRREGRSLTGRRSYRYRVHSVAARDALATAAVSDYVIHAERYGIPQARHRVFLIGVREDLDGVLPTLALKPHSTAADVLEGLPRVRSGLSGGHDSPEKWLAAVEAALDTSWLRWLRRGRQSRWRTTWRIDSRSFGRLVLTEADRSSREASSLGSSKSGSWTLASAASSSTRRADTDLTTCSGTCSFPPLVMSCTARPGSRSSRESCCRRIEMSTTR